MFLNPHPKGFSILAPPQMAMDAANVSPKPRLSQRRTSSFDAAALMQRSDDNYVWTSRRSVTHSNDAANAPSLSELRSLHSQIGEAHDSLGELLKSGRFNFNDARGHALDIAERANRLHGMLGASGEDTEADRDEDWEKARDSVGEVPAKSVVASSGPSKVDHRKDFKSGADSALLDFGQLFQR